MARRQGQTPPPNKKWTQHFAFNSMHTDFGAAQQHSAHLRAAATQGPADSSASIVMAAAGVLGALSFIPSWEIFIYCLNTLFGCSAPFRL